jgi:hypothetical protein
MVSAYGRQWNQLFCNDRTATSRRGADLGLPGDRPDYLDNRSSVLVRVQPTAADCAGAAEPMIDGCTADYGNPASTTSRRA